MKVLGVSCSLRNARYGYGSVKLVEELRGLPDESSLIGYLQAQTKIRLDDFIMAGRNDNQPFDVIYKRLLQHSKGERGLSNSEAALAAGLWGALQKGADIAHLGLATYFPMSGAVRKLDELRRIVLDADAILISGPVYFGDRGSLAQSFMEFLRDDPECAAHIRNRLYGGIAVGAKRNGGQETTLIYQLVDATNMNMLAVGNDSETTAQYGGTAMAGDVGTLHTDLYGIQTSIGTGRRLAEVGKRLAASEGIALRDKVRVQTWLLQDTADHRGRSVMLKLGEAMMVANDQIDFEVLDFTDSRIYRCIACDICPIHPGSTEDYRCIVTNDADLFKNEHEHMIQADAVLIGAYSPVALSTVRSVYQTFTERTRYLRHDDYAIGDRLVAPFVLSEVNANQNLHIRMLTSFLRHHTVLHHPLVGVEYKGDVLNWDFLTAQAESFATNAVRLTVGRLMQNEADLSAVTYKHIGYIIGREQQQEDVRTGAAARALELRQTVHAETRKARV